MFDIAFSEMLIIAVVALVVLGPEKLPKVARTAGLLLGRLQRYVNDVKSDINREMQLDELKKLQTQVEDSARSIERSVTTEFQSAETALNQTAQGVTETVAQVSAEAEAVPAVAAAPTAEIPATVSAPEQLPNTKA
ncbi:MAG: Sec-independent protein translocase subunit TatB [Betaproteobacteria bacterium]|uniref:Sec-independent protein translocase protein TatB n=1 Tax=Candidatus Proximibacter danicus TaxID=2954365 RepID=A0A9D7K1Y5_9PROT|nr:Sec-independent protein translocase subunit TatB [Candidatus Proximibacter danicus]